MKLWKMLLFRTDTHTDTVRVTDTERQNALLTQKFITTVKRMASRRYFTVVAGRLSWRKYAMELGTGSKSGRVTD